MEMCPEGVVGGAGGLTERRLFWMHMLVSAIVPRSGLFNAAGSFAS